MTSNIPLTSGQRFSLEQGIEYVQNEVFTYLFPVKKLLEPKIMRKAVDRVVDAHEALRYRFVCVNTDWKQVVSETNNSQSFKYLSIKCNSLQSWEDILELEIEKAHSHINVTNGPLFHIVLFSLQGLDQQKLLIVINHLITDYNSTLLFISEILEAYCQIECGLPPVARSNSASFKEWGKYCQSRLDSGAVYATLNTHFKFKHIELTRLRERENLSLWPCANTKPLNYSHLMTIVDGYTTDKFSQACHTKFNAWVSVGLLAVLSKSLTGSVTDGFMPISLQESGRLVPECKLSLEKTIGYLTYSWVYFLPIDRELNFSELIARVNEIYMNDQMYGMDFEIACSLPELELGTKARKIYESLNPRIWFSYVGTGFHSSRNRGILGNFENLPTPQRYSSTDFSTLGIVAMIIDKKLTIRWEYCLEAFSERQIFEISQRFLHFLTVAAKA